MVKNPPAIQEAWVRSLGREDPLEIGHGTPLQYSGLENPHGQRSLVRATVQGVAKRRTGLSGYAQHSIPLVCV